MLSKICLIKNLVNFPYIFFIFLKNTSFPIITCIIRHNMSIKLQKIIDMYMYMIYVPCNLSISTE